MINKRALKNYCKKTVERFFAKATFAKKYLPEKRFWELMYKNFPEGKPFCFIQVGANDGSSFDILYDIVKLRESRGIVIEPLKDFYEELCNNYTAFPSIVKVNKAVHPTMRKVDIYRVDPEKQQLVPEWARGIGSLDPEHHKKSETPTHLIKNETVEAAPLMEIVNQNIFTKNIDLLQIDVEGFDFEVLKMIDFKVLQPSVIKYEIVNLSEEDKKESRAMLKKNGYYIFANGDDMVGIKTARIAL